MGVCRSGCRLELRVRNNLPPPVHVPRLRCRTFTPSSLSQPPKGAAPGKAISPRAGLGPEVPAALAFIRVKKRLLGVPLTSDQWRFQGWCPTRAYFGVYGGGGRAGSLFI